MVIVTTQTIVAPEASEAPELKDDSVALLTALAYADLFDFPLSLSELTRFQVGTRISEPDVARCLSSLLSADLVCEQGGYYCLRGREKIFGIRQDRERASRKVWRRARLYAPILGRLPFVRMVAVTGALAVNNLGGQPDIDLFALAEPGRVWICRRFLVALVRVARLFGDDLCPNYILSLSRLELDQRDFFTAHELAQMVPLCGFEHYQKVLQANIWAAQYLPKAFDHSDVAREHMRENPRRITLLERLLSKTIFDRWERWEMRRLRRKLRAQVVPPGQVSEVVCAPDQCKGHTGFHRRSILDRLAARLQELNLRGHIPSIRESSPQ